MTRESSSSRKPAVVLSQDGEVEGHVDDHDQLEKYSSEKEIVYVPYESVANSQEDMASKLSGNLRLKILLSNLLVAIAVALFFQFLGSDDRDNEQTADTRKSSVARIERSQPVQALQPLADLKLKAGLIIDDEQQDIGLVNSFLDSWKEIAPSTKHSFKSSFWFKQFSQALHDKIQQIRTQFPDDEGSEIYAGTLLNLSALLGLKADTAVAQTTEQPTQADTEQIVAGEIPDENAPVPVSTPVSMPVAETKPADPDATTAAQNDDISDIVTELSSQIAKLEAEQRNQIEDQSMHKADLVKNSHSAIGNIKKSDSGYSESDLHYLLGQYATTYEFGDTNRLLALFAAKPGYRRALKRNFKKVFSYSLNRHIEFSDLNWEFYQDSIIGKGKYKATIELKRNKGTRYVSADIQVKMLPTKHSLKIARLDFSAVRSRTIRPKINNQPTAPVKQVSLTKKKPHTAPKLVPTSRPSEPTAAELQDVITRFVGAYESGNIKALDSIFSSNARTNDRNNLREIKSDYKEFFSNTTDRQLYIKDLKWTFNKNLAKGVGNLNALVVATDSDTINSINGEIEIVAKRIKNKVLITHLFHNYAVSRN